MEELANDPIISFYMKMSNSTDSETEVPLYSETMLRLSFKEIFGTMRPIYANELELYRKLILFNFSENYTSITDLIAIMTCFDERKIRTIFNMQEEILAQWRTFLKKNLFNVLYKEALNEVLYEYTIRYLSIYGEVDDEFLKRKAEDVQGFLRCNERLPKQWFRSFKALLKNRMGQSQYEHTDDLTERDLNLVNIFIHIKPRLNILVVEDLSRRLTQVISDKSPPKKRAKLLLATDDNGNNTKTTHSANTIPEEDTEHDIDAEVQIANEVDDDSYGEEEEEEQDTSYSSSIAQPGAIKLETKETVEIQRLDLTQSDSESVITANENNDERHHSENDDNLSSDKSAVESVAAKNRSIIDYDTALSYLAALQAYAVVNVHFEAIGLLDEVDSMFRQKQKQSN